jgi:hypothetical protein
MGPGAINPLSSSLASLSQHRRHSFKLSRYK